MLQTDRWAPCRVKWVCLCENFGLYASFPKWLVPARSHPSAQCPCPADAVAGLCVRSQELVVPDGQWQGTAQLRGSEPPGKQSLPPVKGGFRPCSLPSVVVNHTLSSSYKGTDFFFFFFSEDLKSELVDVSLFCCRYFYFLTVVLLNLFILWHWNCHSISVSPFKTFLCVLPSSFYASVLFGSNRN